ncbi:MAG: flagellar motor protein MotB [Candidatus Sericytochromatia bacterium]|nr:flagellar motor protein MotB [Candidatus Sericytochromatia bacterium]
MAMGHGGGSGERWLITYADMITLLMVFFVVMFASSQTQQAKLLALSDSLKKALNMSAAAAANGTGASILSAPRVSGQTTAVSEAIKAAAKALGLDKGVTVSSDERGTVVSLIDTFFFDPGGVLLKPHAVELLTKVAEFIALTDSSIHVEGHTDNREIKKGIIASNWELSALRATEVVRFFLRNKKIEPERMVAIGYGSTRPLFPNDTEDHRARNRRVDIVLVTADRYKKNHETKEQVNLLSGEGGGIKETEKRQQTETEVHPPIKEK